LGAGIFRAIKIVGKSALLKANGNKHLYFMRNLLGEPAVSG